MPAFAIADVMDGNGRQQSGWLLYGDGTECGCVAPSLTLGIFSAKPSPGWFRLAEDGRGDRIRTCDPLFPKQMRYQAAPLPDIFFSHETGGLNPLRRNLVGPAGFEPATYPL